VRCGRRGCADLRGAGVGLDHGEAHWGYLGGRVFAEVLGEKLDGERLCDVATGDRAEGSGDGRAGEFEADEFAPLEFVANGGFWKDGDGVFDEDRAFEGFDGIELEVGGEGDAGVGEVTVDDFAGGQVGRECDEFVDADEAGGDFGFVGEGAIRGADEDEFIISEGLDFDAGAASGECDESEVGFAGEDVAVDVGGAVVFGRDFDARESRAELAKDGWQVVQADGVNGGDAKGSGCGLGKAGDSDVNVFEDIEDVASGLVEQFSFRGEGYAAAESFEEGHTKTFFERTDLLRDGALGDLIERCGAGEPAGGNEVAKDFERLDLHGVGLDSKIYRESGNSKIN